MPDILLLDADAERTAAVAQRLRDAGMEPTVQPFGSDAIESPSGFAGRVAIVALDAVGGPEREREVKTVLRRLAAERTPTLIYGPGGDGRPTGSALTEWLAPGASVEAVLAKVETLARYVPLLAAMERELEHMSRLGQQLNHYFNEIDQEMRLAGRLQRDFLPAKLPNIPPLKFHAVYRPASWVSGDMYDVFRIDEDHLGLFVADAMGHGVAAGLLTMFLRQGLISKHIDGNEYTILTPAEALDHLHACLVKQKLPNCQFVTAAYAVADLRSCRVRLSRGGHPYAIHIRPDEPPTEVRVEGSLLGLADVPADFEQTEITLAPGEKLFLYTDGLEESILAPRTTAGVPTEFTPLFHEWAAVDGAEIVARIEAHLDGQEGSLHPTDDVTVLVVERGSD